MQRISSKIESDSEKSDVCSHLNELRDTFYSNSKKGNVFHVRLNSVGLILQRDSAAGEPKDHIVNICDIIGGRCVWIRKPSSFGSASTCGACSPNSTVKENYRDEDEDAYLYVFAYILKKNIRNVIRRERTVITLRFRSFDSHEDNMREAEKWYKTLKSHRNNYLLLCDVNKNDLTLKTLQAKRLLFLLNPKSGSGKARDLFNQEVVPILNEAEVVYDLQVTKHSHYASEFVRQRNLFKWNGIVAIGGDGLFHEIINGIFKRSDWNSVLRSVTLGIVPCGSGNGLARSIAHCFQEPYDPKPILGASLSLVGGQSALMDVVEIEVHNKITYSFLSVGWGLISDIDIESERLRPLGYQRFTIWTLHRLINLRTYRGKISYLPKKLNSEQKNSEVTKQNLQYSMSCNTFPTPIDLKKCNGKTEFEDIISLETVANQSCLSRCNSLISSESRLSSYYSIDESIYHSITGNSDCCQTDLPNSDGPATYGISRLCPLEEEVIPYLHEPLPGTWLVEDGEFVMIHAVYQTHLGSDCYFSPHSKLNDGTIYLVMIRGGISRSQLFNFLINMSSGNHLPKKNNEYIRVERVVAFRLEPHDNSGILSIDGERIDCGSLQARIFPGTINVMVPNKVDFKDC